MNIFSVLISIFLAITPPSTFECDGKLLTATIRNNINGDFALTTNLEMIDQGAFVVLDWERITLMLPVSFQQGEISFTDRKWLWSYQDNEVGLHPDTPRLAQRLQSGEIIEHECKVAIVDSA